MQAIITIEGDVAAAKAGDASRIAIWRSFKAVEDLTNHQPYTYVLQELAFDRSNGQLVNCCGNFVGADHHLHPSGQGFIWPFNAGKHSYEVFDSNVLKPMLFQYVGPASTDGITT